MSKTEKVEVPPEEDVVASVRTLLNKAHEALEDVGVPKGWPEAEGGQTRFYVMEYNVDSKQWFSKSCESLSGRLIPRYPNADNKSPLVKTELPSVFSLDDIKKDAASHGWHQAMPYVEDITAPGELYQAVWYGGENNVVGRHTVAMHGRHDIAGTYYPELQWIDERPAETWLAILDDY